jgi:hypothetical protein
VETNGHVVDVGKDGTFGTFAEDKRRRESDFLAESEGWIIFSKNSEHAMK